MPFTVQRCTVNLLVKFPRTAKYSWRFFYLIFAQGCLHLLEFKMRLVWISVFYKGTEKDSLVGNEASLEAKLNFDSWEMLSNDSI